MKPHAIMRDGAWTEIVGAFEDADGISHAANVLELWSEPELRAIGVVEIAEASTAPLGHQRLVGVELADVAGVPMRAGIFEELTLQERKAVMQAQARQKRWEHEQAGFTGPGGHVRTDDTAQGKLAGVIALFGLRLRTNPEPSPVDFEISPGVWATASYADLIAVSLAVGNHVQACFTRSRQIDDAIEAARAHKDLTAIDLTAGWPQ